MSLSILLCWVNVYVYWSIITCLWQHRWSSVFDLVFIWGGVHRKRLAVMRQKWTMNVVIILWFVSNYGGEKPSTMQNRRLPSRTNLRLTNADALLTVAYSIYHKETPSMTLVPTTKYPRLTTVLEHQVNPDGAVECSQYFLLKLRSLIERAASSVHMLAIFVCFTQNNSGGIYTRWLAGQPEPELSTRN